jgi:glycosyltransferase involved in cell wall biosynthesis
MLADGLARRGIPVTVYGPAATWAAAVRVVAGVSAEPRDGPGLPEFAAVEIAARPRPSRDLAAIRRLRALVSRDRPDVVHAHGLRAGALAALAVGRSTASRPRLVVTIHNAAPGRGPAAAVYRVLERIVAARADTVLCVSGDLEARMRGLGSRNVAPAVVAAPVTPPRVPAETLAAVRAEFGAGGTPDRTPVILTVARLAPQKGLGTLIGAAARWRDRSPVPLLVIAGAGPLAASLSAQAVASGARVRLAGQRDDVPALLAAADVVVVPSVWEGQPLIVQEALRAGRPLVASRAGGIAALTGEDAALLVPPGDGAALAAAVITVLDDPALAARLSAAAARRAMALPSERDAVDAAMAAYQRVPPG